MKSVRVGFIYLCCCVVLCCLREVTCHGWQTEVLWSQLQEAVKHFDNPFFKASSNDVSNKAKLYMGKETLSFVIAPLSLELSLMAISLGTTGGTLRQLDKGMRLNMTKENKKETLEYCMETLFRSDDYRKLEMLNMMFIREDLRVKDSFVDFATRALNTTVDKVNFSNITESRININKMIAKRVRRKMKDILDDSDLDPNRNSLIFVSSVYYKNRWLYPPTVLNGTWDFRENLENSNHTKVKMFRVNGDMMYADIPEIDAKVVEIPYITPGFSMILYLPNQVGNLLAMEEKILEWENILEKTQASTRRLPVAVSLPRFYLEAAVLLPGKLKMMGMDRIFTVNAELDNVFDGGDVSITNFIQKIKFWGNEGRGAFKDTGDEELPKPEKIVFADHPFMFIIKMNDTSFLMGHFLV